MRRHGMCTVHRKADLHMLPPVALQLNLVLYVAVATCDGRLSNEHMVVSLQYEPLSTGISSLRGPYSATSGCATVCPWLTDAPKQLSLVLLSCATSPPSTLKSSLTGSITAVQGAR